MASVLKILGLIILIAFVIFFGIFGLGKAVDAIWGG